MRMVRFVSIGLFGLLGACDGGGTGDCAENEIAVRYLGGSRDGEVRCAPIPASCATPVSCAQDQCRGTLYGLCDAGYIGVACSDNFQPVDISCNPDE